MEFGLDRRLRGRPLAVWCAIVLLVQLGVSGLAGGAQFVLVPSGAAIGMTPAALAGSPFADYLLPGLLLLSVLGVGPLVVAVGLYRGASWARAGTAAVGMALVVWVAVEALVIGVGERFQYPHLVQAAAILLLAASGALARHCSRGTDRPAAVDHA